VYYIFKNYFLIERIQLTERVKGIKKNKKVPNVLLLKAEYLMIFYLDITTFLGYLMGKA
jgi:hypothetical protein